MKMTDSKNFETGSCKKVVNTVNETKSEPDLYRDTWVRYLGYANEVGEAFRSLVHVRVVHASYTLATGYVVADTADKAYKEYQRTSDIKSVAIATGDAFLWQTLASIVIPGYVINRLCAFSLYTMKRAAFPSPVGKWLTACVGLASVPFIVHPIDDGVTYIMEKTYRKVF